MIKSKSLITVFTLLLALSMINIENAYAGRGRRGGGASRRANSSVRMQNRGNFSGGQRSTNRSQNIENRQSTRQNRQDNRGNYNPERQGERTERTEIRQGERTERTDIRQGERSDRQNNRQDFIDDNYYGRGWYGSGYYSPPGWGAWGAAAFATGVVVGAVVSSPPPYYDTVVVGSTTYIYSDGVFMQSSGGSYTVVNPPVGAVVTYLPEGCTQTGSYFDCGGIYFQPSYQGSTNVYKVIQL
jgi:hypothetical protein